MPILSKTSLLLACLAVLACAPTARAADYVLTLKDHAFTPKDLTIPQNQKVKLTVKNASDVTAEFESSDLNREKVVTAGSEVTVFIGPLDPGTYAYVDDFHRETTGVITVK